MERFNQTWLETAGELLRHLPSVYAARVLASEDGDELKAIHLLTGLDRNPKQIVRDVQSALSAAYGLDIDHRIISVAQMPVNPLDDGTGEDTTDDVGYFPAAQGGRPRYCGISIEEFARRVNIKVSLEYEGIIYEGTAAGQSGSIWRDRLAALATIDAIRKLPGENNEYILLGVQPMQTSLIRISIVLVQYQEDGLILTGAATVEEGSLHGVVRATLDAVNRHLSRRLNGQH